VNAKMVMYGPISRPDHVRYFHSYVHFKIAKTV
jgi:hypothetical protein